LIELASTASNSAFNYASAIEKSNEELLMDGAVDQTFAFNRTTFVQLTAIKIELND